jgi:hypothetical protein
MVLESRVDALESELRLIKAEIQTTLIDLRDFLAGQEFAMTAKPERRSQGTSGGAMEAGVLAPHNPETREPPMHQNGAPAQVVMPNGRPVDSALVQAGPATAVVTGADPAHSGLLAGMGPGVIAQDSPATLLPNPRVMGVLTPGPVQVHPPAQPLPQHPAPTGPSVSSPPPSAAAASDPATSFAAPPVQVEAVSIGLVKPDLRLLVGALKWAALATTQLGPDGPRQVIEMYHAVLPMPDNIKQVLTLAANEQSSSTQQASVLPPADSYALLLLSLHGLLWGGNALGWGAEG